MPIRFRCQRCRQLLGIASRKAGSEVQCPKCGISQVVPNEEAALAALAMDQFARTHEAIEGSSNVVVYEDEPSAIETPRPRPTEKTPSSTSNPATVGAPPVSARSQPGLPVPRGMILYSRRTIYVQGLLLVMLAVVAFGSGYFIGRGDANYRQQIDQDEADRVRVPIQGKLVYDPGTGQKVGDGGAVIIALPQRESPQKKIPFEGLRPQDPPLSKPGEGVRRIRELGGEYTRAQASGEFYMVAPDKGKYHLLIISKHTTRAQGSEADEVDLSEMGDYFSMADALVSHYKYHWLSEEIDAGFNPIEYDFGRDKQR